MNSKPTYPLADVCRLARLEGKRSTTTSAQKDARNDFSYWNDDIYGAVACLVPTDFVKSMPSEKNPGLFQDVYKPVIKTPNFPSGIRVYCKVQIVNGNLVVISFKVA